MRGLQLSCPTTRLAGGLHTAHAAHTGKEDGLFAHFHLLVQASFLGHIANLVYVIGGYLMAFKPDFTAVRNSHMIDHTYERGLTGSVGAEQTVDGAARDLHRYIVKSLVSGICLGHVLDLKN